MKMNKKKIAVLMMIASVMSILLMLFLYFGVPKYLCKTVYGVNESDLSQMEVIEIPAKTQFIENFVPTSKYMKSIAASFRVQNNEANENCYVVAKVLDSKGNVLSESSNEVSACIETFDCEFEVEKWVDTSERYSFILEIPNCEGIAITCVAYEAGPNEHIELQCADNLDINNIYLRYTYGAYSKKLAVMYFLVFWISSFMIEEAIAEWKCKR
ncbi:MAG: hypothetical protein E7299_07230 [Lachnospiraceae bacterium]|nr:hypothetical protein [Lachnospiraceae bacterium]